MHLILLKSNVSNCSLIAEVDFVGDVDDSFLMMSHCAWL